MKMQANRIAETIWEIPTTEKQGMLVPARIYATEQLFNTMDEAVYDQITNVATLPGITKYALCMPDGHSGYGFPIGGVAAMDVEQGGVISPGGIGFDINCGMRLVVTNLTYEDIKPYVKELVDRLFERVPAGVGSTGFVKLSRAEFRRVVEEGAGWCIKNGYGWPEDLELTEESGCIAGADAAKISDKAIDRGVKQIGTLGSGNHYLEIQVAHRDNIHDEALARRFGITIPDQVVVMFHCGSRGFGHQVATDYLQVFLKVMESKYHIKILDRELACAPFNAPEGRDYFAAMKCGLNMSFANRQVILHRIREVFSAVLNRSPEDLGMHMVYDVAHNTAKLERHRIDGEERTLLVHRKGATRAFPGQPVIVPGDMGRYSFVLVGTETAMRETFGSTCHGAGRVMSRTAAVKAARGRQIGEELRERGVVARAAGHRALAEEMPEAYKDVKDVVEVVHRFGISSRVARLRPLGVVKG
jgi:tRNA-splicing ligase RtcB (3'-phosphate/5'-hydroxy nucleic acid ligase)